jgi:hypothetical protein
VYDNRKLRRMVGLKGKEVKGGCRELNNEELHNLKFSILMG